ncbi:MAG: energy transducer TonB, partial [Bacteroidota bacterium]|nr:energy transducer TonB [Bacteroidota bacterium]
VTLYDSNWQPTTDKTQATYYRTSNFDSTGHRYIVQDYYATGQLYRTGTYKSLNPEIRDGVFIWYFNSGRKNKEISYANNVIQRWQVLNEKGESQLAVVLTFKGTNGETLSEAFKVDKEPAFVGGTKAMKTFIRKNLVYPPVTSVKPVDGIVLVYCDVSDSGKLINLKVIKRIHPDLDREALKVVELMPAWNPGLANGVPVTVPYVIPVKFQNKSSQDYSRNNSERNKGRFSY